MGVWGMGGQGADIGTSMGGQAAQVIITGGFMYHDHRIDLSRLTSIDVNISLDVWNYLRRMAEKYKITVARAAAILIEEAIERRI